MPRHMPRIGQPPVERALDSSSSNASRSGSVGAQVLGRLLAVAARVDVAARRRAGSVADVERVVEVAVHARQHEPDPAGERERPLVADSRVVAEVVEAEREADDGLPSAPCHWIHL